jgi:poly-D-alanine transfer protein DltD
MFNGKISKMFKSLFNKKSNKSSRTNKVENVPAMELAKEEKKSFFPIFKSSKVSKVEELRRMAYKSKKNNQLRDEIARKAGTGSLPLRAFGNCRRLKVL